MTVYLIGFALSVFILWVIRDWRIGSIGFVFWSVVALLIPCLIAGLRDVSIGTDVEAYAQPLFNLAVYSDSFGEFYNSSWWSSWHEKYVENFEIGFVVLAWVTAKTTGRLAAFLFCIQLVSVVPIYAGLVRFRGSVPAWLGMLLYYFMFFNYTLNMMRQWMAMGILFFGVYYLFERKYLKYIITTLVASLFHTSALIGFLVLFIYVVVTGKERKTDVKMVALAAIAAVIGLVALSAIAQLLTAMGFSRYAGYLGDGQVTLQVNQILFRLPVLAILLFNWKRMEKVTPAFGFLVVMSIFDLAVSQLGSVGEQSARIALFFSEYAMLSLPMAALSNGQTVNKYVWYLVIAVYAFAYWYVAFVYLGWGETFPYVFA